MINIWLILTFNVFLYRDFYYQFILHLDKRSVPYDMGYKACDKAGLLHVVFPHPCIWHNVWAATDGYAP
jgi:hypothetical protein